MLSKTERDFPSQVASGTNTYTKNYKRVLKSRILTKVRKALEDLGIIEKALGVTITKFGNDVTKNRNGPAIRIFPETARFLKTRCGRRDLDPGLELGRLQS